MVDAAALVTEKYLDGKPSHRGKHKITHSDRDTEFWSAAFLAELSAEIWSTDVMILALSRYLGQERVSATPLMTSIARSQPSAICRAIRYARMVYQPKVARLTELREIATYSPEIHEQCSIIDIFLDAHSVRQAEIDKWHYALAGLSPFELLIYASLFPESVFI